MFVCIKPALHDYMNGKLHVGKHECERFGGGPNCRQVLYLTTMLFEQEQKSFLSLLSHVTDLEQSRGFSFDCSLNRVYGELASCVSKNRSTNKAQPSGVRDRTV